MKNCALKLAVRHTPTSAPKCSSPRWWMLAMSALAHVSVLVLLGRTVTRESALPVAVAEFAFVEMPARILPADGEADSVASGSFHAPTTEAWAGGASPTLTAMSWSPPAGANELKMPVFAPPSAGEVLGVEISDWARPVGAWMVAAGTGRGPLSGLSTGESVASASGAVLAATSNGVGGGLAGDGASVSRNLPGYLRNPRPAYPRLAAENGWQGTTLLHVQVLANGLPGQLKVLESSGHDVLDQAALATVRRWRFIPARRNNVAVEVWVEIPIQFTLETDKEIYARQQ